MNFLSILIEHAYPLDDEELGILVSDCFEWLGSDKATPAVKLYSMKILCIITHHIRELKNELILIIEDQMPKNPISFKSRGKKILKLLQEL